VPSRNPPLFSPDIFWSISNHVRLELPRKTNTAGSWHKELNRLTPPHPGKNHITNFINIFNIYNFIYFIKGFTILIVQKIQVETESQIELLISGHQIQEKKYGLERNLRLQFIQQRINDNPNFYKLDFLKAVVYNLSI